MPKAGHRPALHRVTGFVGMRNSDVSMISAFASRQANKNQTNKKPDNQS
jgi:hypothetical protein